jgi:hypothetical protein
MEADEERIDQAYQEISYLYHYDHNVERAIELMRDQNVSSDLVKSIYNELSRKAEKSRTERFHYYTYKNDMNEYFNVVDCWTSRYLLGYRKYILNPAFHEIKIIDIFNNKSM